jgi:hypothetical protein
MGLVKKCKSPHTLKVASIFMPCKKPVRVRALPKLGLCSTLTLCGLLLTMPPTVQRTVTVAGLNFELAGQYNWPVVLHVDDT